MLVLSRKASMGPRSNDLGKLNRSRASPAAIWASMGPRSNDLGKLGSATLEWLPDSLQWGRDRMISERLFAEAGEFGIFALQWGRDRMISESRLQNTPTTH